MVSKKDGRHCFRGKKDANELLTLIDTAVILTAFVNKFIASVRMKVHALDYMHVIHAPIYYQSFLNNLYLFNYY